MIVINYGSEIKKVTYTALKASDILKYLKPGMAVAIKPNLVVSRGAEQGATTHPEVVEGIIEFLLEVGIEHIKIIEGSWVGDNTKRAYKNCGYTELSKRYNIPLLDLKDDGYTTMIYKEFKLDVCNQALETDFLINVPVLKAHCQTLLTCSMKNLKGCIPDSEKRNYHNLGIHKPVAALNAVLKTGYCVVDSICGDLSFEEGGNPVQSNRIIVGRDVVEVDSYCAELIGYKPDEIGYLKYAQQYALGNYYSDQTEIKELSIDSKPKINMKNNNLANKYKNIILEDSACSACYASLVFALERIEHKKLSRLGKICIGQGYKNKTEDFLGTEAIGIGNCTKQFKKSVKGCPPKALDIVKLLKK